MEQQLKVNLGGSSRLDYLWKYWNNLGHNRELEEHIIIGDNNILVKNININSYDQLQYFGNKDLSFVNVQIESSLFFYDTQINVKFFNSELYAFTARSLKSFVFSKSTIRNIEIQHLNQCSIDIDEKGLEIQQLDHISIRNIEDLELKLKNISQTRATLQSCQGNRLLLQNFKADQIHLSDCSFNRASINNSSSELRVNDSNFDSLNLYRHSGFLGIYDSSISTGKLNQCPKSTIIFENNTVQNEVLISNNKNLEFRQQDFEKIKLSNNDEAINIIKPKNHTSLDLRDNLFTEITIEGIDEEEQIWNIKPSENASLGIKECHLKRGELKVESKSLKKLKLSNLGCSEIRLINRNVDIIDISDIRINDFHLKATNAQGTVFSNIEGINENSNLTISINNPTVLNLSKVQGLQKISIKNNTGEVYLNKVKTDFLHLRGKNLTLFVLQFSNIEQMDLESDKIENLGILSTISESKDLTSRINIDEISHVKIENLQLSSSLEFKSTELQSFAIYKSIFHSWSFSTTHCNSLHFENVEYEQLAIESISSNKLQIKDTRPLSNNSSTTIQINNCGEIQMLNLTDHDTIELKVFDMAHISVDSCKSKEFVVNQNSGNLSITDISSNTLDINGKLLQELSLTESKFSEINLNTDTISELVIAGIQALDIEEKLNSTIKVQNCKNGVIKAFRSHGPLGITILKGSRILMEYLRIQSLTLHSENLLETIINDAHLELLKFSGQSKSFNILNTKHQKEEIEVQFDLSLESADEVFIQKSEVNEIKINSIKCESLSIDESTLESLLLKGNFKKISITENLTKDWSCQFEGLKTDEVDLFKNAIQDIEVSLECELNSLIINKNQLTSEKVIQKVTEHGSKSSGIKTKHLIGSLKISESRIQNLSSSDCCVEILKVTASILPDCHFYVDGPESELFETESDSWTLTFPYAANAKFLQCDFQSINISSQKEYTNSKIHLENCSVKSSFEISKLGRSSLRLNQFSASDFSINNSHLEDLNWIRPSSASIESIQIRNSTIDQCIVHGLESDAINFLNTNTKKIKLEFVQSKNLKLENFEFNGSGAGTEKFEMNFIKTILDEGERLSFINTDLSKLKMNSCYFETFKTLEVASSKLDEISCTATTWPKKVVSYEDAEKKKLHFFEIREACRQLKMAMANHQDRVSELQFHALEMNAYSHITRNNFRLNKSGDLLSLWAGWTNGFGLKWLRPIALMVIIISSLYIWFLTSYHNQPVSWEFIYSKWNSEDFVSFLNPTHRISQLTLDRPFPRLAVVADFLSKIFSAFFIYQIVVAFRKFRK